MNESGGQVTLLQQRLVGSDHSEALTSISAAAEAAKKQDLPALRQLLKTAGEWVLNIAKEVGKSVAARAIEDALRL